MATQDPASNQLTTVRARLDEDPDGWAQWDVHDAAGNTVGAIAEHRPWHGHRRGEVRYDVACRPDPLPAAACWNRTDTATTITEALDLLAAHRREHHPEAAPHQ